MQNLYIENYSDKSFVIKGDSRNFKEDLKKMGGKWNAQLTDKDSGEKFGGWIFWLNKKSEVEKWLESSILPNNRIEQMEEVLYKMISIFQKLKLDKDNELTQTSFYKNLQGKRLPTEDDFEYLDEDPGFLPRPPRLLKK